MARASSVVSARAMAPGSLTQQRNRTKLADSCSATVAGFYAAVDTFDLRHAKHDQKQPQKFPKHATMLA